MTVETTDEKARARREDAQARGDEMAARAREWTSVRRALEHRDPSDIKQALTLPLLSGLSLGPATKASLKSLRDGAETDITAALAEVDAEIANAAGWVEWADGIERSDGLDAAAEATAGTSAATRAGPDPLDGLADRIREGEPPELAFDAAVIEAALDLEIEDSAAFAALRRALKSAGVTITPWGKAIDRARASRRERDKLAREQLARESARRQRDAAALAASLEAEKRAEMKAEAQDSRGAHFGEIAVDDLTYFMEPGRVWMEEPGPRGTIKTTTLSNFSAPIVADVSDFTAPDARPERTCAVDVILGAAGSPRTIEVPQRDFERMEWVGPLLGARASVGAGRGARDHLRRAMQLLSDPSARSRYRFTGWTREAGASIYLHAKGAIGTEAPIEVAPPSPVDRFALPPAPTGDGLARARDHVLELCCLEPASAVLAIVGQAFRAALGEARCSVHVYGGAPGTGKSLLCAFGQGFFGPGFHEDNPPLSWRSGGGDTAVSMNIILATAGDCVAWIDDLKLSGGNADGELMRKADQVFSQVFSGKARTMGRREGGMRANPAPRSVVLSSGEVLPRAGNSLVQRLVPVLYPHRMEGGDVMAVRAGTLAGVSAQFMAAFLAWVAPQREKIRAGLTDREARAAAEWGLGSTPRAVKLFGALAVGLRALCAFLREIDTDAETVRALEERSHEALRALSGEYDDVAQEQDPVETFLRLLGDAIASGECHVTTPQGCAPKDCHLFGWRPKSSVATKSTEGFDEAPSYQPCGLRIGHVNRGLDRLYITPSTAFRVVQSVGRGSNQVINLDLADLGRRLMERGHLAAHEYETNRTFTTRARVRPEGAEESMKLTRGFLCLHLRSVVAGAEAVSEGETAERDSGAVTGFQGDS